MLRNIIRKIFFQESLEKESQEEKALIPKDIPNERWEKNASFISSSLFEKLKPAVSYFDDKIRKIRYGLRQFKQDLEQQTNQKPLDYLVRSGEKLEINFKNAHSVVKDIEGIIHTHLHANTDFVAPYVISDWRFFVREKKAVLHRLEQEFTHLSKNRKVSQIEKPVQRFKSTTCR